MRSLSFLTQPAGDETLTDANEVIHKVNSEIVPPIRDLEARVEVLYQMVAEKQTEIDELRKSLKILSDAVAAATPGSLQSFCTANG